MGFSAENVSRSSGASTASPASVSSDPHTERSEAGSLTGERKRTWVAPIMLGVLFAFAAACLVMVELAEPPKSEALHGITLSNAINSRGARNGLALFRGQLSWLPSPASGVVLSPEPYLLGLRLSIVAMGALQAIALIWVWRRPSPKLWPWMVGPVLATAILLFYPPINTDIFSYASFGWVASSGHNPYLVAPRDLPGDPYAAMNDWTHITTPYGPIWTGLSRLAVLFGRNDPFAVALILKAMAGAAAIGLAVATYGVALHLTANRRAALSAFMLVGWSPVLLYESAGAAHNDAVMMLLAVAGLFLAMDDRSGAIRTGLLLIAAAALIKPIALPLLVLAALVRLGRPHQTTPELLRRWLLDLAAVGVLAVVAFAPYWAAGTLPEAIWMQQRDLYLSRPLRVNPLWVWAFPGIARQIGGSAAADWAVETATFWSRLGVIVLLAIAVYVAAAPLLRSRRSAHPLSDLPRRVQVPAWAAVTAALGLMPLNAHAWYAIWALAPIALLWATAASSRIRLLLALCSVWILASFLVYHTWVA